jgi:hypothetical protein
VTGRTLNGTAVPAIEAIPSIAEHHKISEDTVTDETAVDHTVRIPPVKLKVFSDARWRQKKVLQLAHLEPQTASNVEIQWLVVLHESHCIS